MFTFLKQLLCRHNRVYIYRANAICHPEHHSKGAWTDVLKVFNYVRCKDCGKFLDAHKDNRERIFGEPEPS